VRWPRDTSAHANKLGDDFKTHLKAVAEVFARHERVDSVSRRHVDEAFAALARLGLQSKRWWQRSDSWTAVGAFLIGVSFSIPDACSALSRFLGWNEELANAASVPLMFATMALGIVIGIVAIHRGSVPRKPGTA
jgi:cytochrome c biogenesis protein CcdA